MRFMLLKWNEKFKLFKTNLFIIAFYLCLFYVYFFNDKDKVFQKYLLCHV